ncbi:ParB N-terminal domain-containing protein [Cronobacter dublinensis]|nr:ParB N-terminal domain-containing protein [Cronobacter dublinensis]EKF2291191.1 ParB N-terminal domain-containing protein [Cronobacter dublinensis]EKF2295207.1 ParB N-terminal domain-containing protein [Cronobacter dublinensis]EKK5270378.1 ParB N-terminal domain-containing protein [Cronobacter dublinensis]EKM0136023.1 ParB N-terminal domain-containing protein [Cronobacter dublinensis]
MNNSMHTLITLPLKDLRPFDMNPRLTRNPDYEEIKASVRLRGLDHPPHITQRPGELFYIIANGGNTRLAVLNELRQESIEPHHAV